MDRAVVHEFKKPSTITLTATDNSFGVLTTYIKWKDSSGGYPIQEMRLEDGTWTRHGTSADTWSPWKALHKRTTWTAVGNGVSYRITDGLCTVRGNSVNTIAATTSGTLLDTLPTEARPTVDIIGAATTKAAATGQYEIKTNGEVRVWNFAGSSTYWAFCVTYPINF